MRPTPSPSKNGTRQLQASKAAAENTVLVKAPTADPSKIPATLPKKLQLPSNPRRPGAAPSTKPLSADVPQLFCLRQELVAELRMRDLDQA